MMRRALIVCLLVAPLYAHEGIHEQLEAATRAITSEPRNAALYLKRGELYRLHKEWKNAERDYDRARGLEPELHAVELARGRMLFDSGRARDAIAPLQRYVRAIPSDANGHTALARALVAANRTSDAVKEFELALAGQADPDLSLEYAAALNAAGRRDDALRYLDSLPPLVTLQLAAIDLELRAGNAEGALRRVDAAMAGASRKEEWLERRGDLLVKLGRAAEAKAAYQAALDAMSTLPPERRRTRAATAMERRLRGALSSELSAH